MKIDLHTHTSSSDGALGAKELIEKALGVGITTISVSDHDTVSALKTSRDAALSSGLTFIPGIEITSRYKSFQLHFLGYLFDFTDVKFIRRLQDLRDARISRAKRIIAKLNSIRIPLKLEAVLERAGENNPVGRPHIASTMVEEGYARTYDEVFHKYIGIGRPAYEANHPFPPEDAIKMISDAGGVSYLAHPSHFVSEDLLKYLLKLGLDGVEVIHPSHSPEETDFYRRFATEQGILMCGGSDFHGGLKNDDGNLGRYLAEEAWLQALEKRTARNIR